MTLNDEILSCIEELDLPMKRTDVSAFLIENKGFSPVQVRNSVGRLINKGALKKYANGSIGIPRKYLKANSVPRASETLPPPRRNNGAAPNLQNNDLESAVVAIGNVAEANEHLRNENETLRNAIEKITNICSSLRN